MKLFLYYFGASFVSASLGYLLLHALIGDRVFGALYRMFVYHWDHPFQYIAVTCLLFAILTSFVTPFAIRLSGWRRVLAVVGVMLSSVAVASVPGGVLWSIHDMQAGYFPPGERFWRALGWGASEGLRIGWLVIALSFPYNAFGLLIGYFITDYGFRFATKVAKYQL